MGIAAVKAKAIKPEGVMTQRERVRACSAFRVTFKRVRGVWVATCALGNWRASGRKASEAADAVLRLIGDA